MLGASLGATAAAALAACGAPPVPTSTTAPAKPAEAPKPAAEPSLAATPPGALSKPAAAGDDPRSVHRLRALGRAGGDRAPALLQRAGRARSAGGQVGRLRERPPRGRDHAPARLSRARSGGARSRAGSTAGGCGLRVTDSLTPPSRAARGGASWPGCSGAAARRPARRGRGHDPLGDVGLIELVPDLPLQPGRDDDPPRQGRVLGQPAVEGRGRVGHHREEGELVDDPRVERRRAGSAGS